MVTRLLDCCQWLLQSLFIGRRLDRISCQHLGHWLTCYFEKNDTGVIKISQTSDLDENLFQKTVHGVW